MLTLLLLPWLRELFFELPALIDVFGAALELTMDKAAYRHTGTKLQWRIHRLEENIENSCLEAAQKSALPKERRQLTLETVGRLRWDIAEVNEIRKGFEEL